MRSPAFIRVALAMLAVLLVSGVWTSEAHAQEVEEPTFGQKLRNGVTYPFRKMFGSGGACVTARQCPFDEQVCSPEGYCMLPPGAENRQGEGNASAEASTQGTSPPARSSQDNSWQNQTTQEECDRDRRCRIDRLRRRNEARRYQSMVREEQELMAFQENVARERAESIPRTAKPLAAEFYVSFGFGLAAMYTVSDHLRLEGTLTYIDAYVDAETVSMGQTIYSSGYIDGWNGGAALTYLMRTRWWTPYLSLAMILHRGSYSSWGNFGDFFEDFGGNSDTQSVLHLAEGRFGFDVQLKAGARARLGILYRLPIYAQAKLGPGSYDESSRKVLQEWINGSRRIAPELSIGWAF